MTYILFDIALFGPRPTLDCNHILVRLSYEIIIIIIIIIITIIIANATHNVVVMYYNAAVASYNYFCTKSSLHWINYKSDFSYRQHTNS